MSEKDFVFISYKSRERVVADRVAKVLKHHGFRCFMDYSSIPPGEGFPSYINEHVEKCSCMVVVFSRLSQESPDVQTEVGLARKYRKKIIPLMINEFEINSSFEYLFQQIQILSIDPSDIYIDSPDMDSTIREIGKVCRSYEEKTPLPQEDNVDIDKILAESFPDKNTRELFNAKEREILGKWLEEDEMILDVIECNWYLNPRERGFISGIFGVFTSISGFFIFHVIDIYAMTSYCLLIFSALFFLIFYGFKKAKERYIITNKRGIVFIGEKSRAKMFTYKEITDIRTGKINSKRGCIYITTTFNYIVMTNIAEYKVLYKKLCKLADNAGK